MYKPYTLTIHAVEQFIRRWEPEKTYEQAEDELYALLGTSRTVGKSLKGHTIVVSGHRPEVRMVIKDHNVCVTVLPENTWSKVISVEEDDYPSEEAILQKELVRYYQDCKSSYAERLTNLQTELTDSQNRLIEVNEERAALGQEKTQLLIEIEQIKRELKEVRSLIETMESLSC
jgi:hypothetical protein